VPQTMLNFLKEYRRGAIAAGLTEVGYAIVEAKAALIWDDPEPFRRDLPRPASSKSVQVCPAALDLDARHFIVKCPVDLNLKILLVDGKPPALVSADGAKSTIRPKHIGEMVQVVAPREWRDPRRPILQIITP
jgi:hypothetical protein